MMKWFPLKQPTGTTVNKLWFNSYVLFFRKIIDLLNKKMFVILKWIKISFYSEYLAYGQLNTEFLMTSWYVICLVFCGL